LLPETYLKVTAEHPNTDAGSRALLLAAAGSFSRGKYVEAKAQFESFRRDYHDSPFVNQALLGVAACLDAQGKTGEAVTAYNEILQHYSTDNVAVQAKLALGWLHERQGKLELAREAYGELMRANIGSISSEAGMRLGELFARHPELMAAKQSSTNLPAITLPQP
jgi:outer membrane protein assembly factor BamD (BamD/ComL family)